MLVTNLSAATKCFEWIRRHLILRDLMPIKRIFTQHHGQPSSFRVTQILDGGMEGLTICSREDTVTIGREDCDMSFPEDLHLSPQHGQVDLTNDRLRVVDNESQNGVYVRIRGEQELNHGDYLFVGQQLLRVEVTT